MNAWVAGFWPEGWEQLSYRGQSLWLVDPHEAIHAGVLGCLLEEFSERVDHVNTVGLVGGAYSFFLSDFSTLLGRDDDWRGVSASSGFKDGGVDFEGALAAVAKGVVLVVEDHFHSSEQVGVVPEYGEVVFAGF